MPANKKILVIVESPAKSKTISKYLGKGYVIRASYGHIFDLTVGGKNGFGVDIENGFKPKYVVNPDKKDKIKSIIIAAKQAKAVYIAADKDREGEAIAWHVAQSIKKTIKIPIYRVIFDEITKPAIKKAIESLGDLNKDLYDAQQARRVLDRIVGFSVSPFVINKFGPNLSAGRVQSVAVRLVVDRERENLVISLLQSMLIK
jgi:DNA topoisomerase-1